MFLKTRQSSGLLLKDTRRYTVWTGRGLNPTTLQPLTPLPVSPRPAADRPPGQRAGAALQDPVEAEGRRPGVGGGDGGQRVPARGDGDPHLRTLRGQGAGGQRLRQRARPPAGAGLLGGGL